MSYQLISNEAIHNLLLSIGAYAVRVDRALPAPDITKAAMTAIVREWLLVHLAQIAKERQAEIAELEALRELVAAKAKTEAANVNPD